MQRASPSTTLRPAAARLAALVALLCAGCAHDLRVAPRPVPPERVAALVQVATSEWERWGRLDVRVPARDEFCAELPDGRCLRIDDGCGREQDAALCPVVNEYWDAVHPGVAGGPRHWCTQAQHCEAQWLPAWGAPDDTPPWSAAFVSAMMRRAGFVEPEFVFSDTHADYVVAARDGLASAYEAVPTPATASVGDLVCATRQAHAGEPSPATLAQLRAGRQATPMHCDIVIDVDADAHVLEAIGGNVQQSVARSRVALDAANRVAPTLNPERPWIAVLRLRKAAAEPAMGRNGATPPGE